MWGLRAHRVCLVALFAALTEAFSNGAPASACTHTGIPHGAAEQGDTPVLIMASADATYQPGVPQDVVISLDSTKAPQRASPKYGFLITALDSKGTILSNALASGDANTVQVKQCAGLGPNSYATHVAAGPVNTWTVKFTPPADAQGEIELKTTVVDTNSDSSPGGDKVYTTSVQLSPSQQGAATSSPAAAGQQPAGANPLAGTTTDNTPPPTTDNTPPPMLVNSPPDQVADGSTPLPGTSNELDMNPGYVQNPAGAPAGGANAEAPLEVIGDTEEFETMPAGEGAPAGETMAATQPTAIPAPVDEALMTTDGAMETPTVEEASAPPAATTQAAVKKPMATMAPTKTAKPTKTTDKYGKDGYDDEGYNKKGYDKKGYNKKGYDVEGYNKKGYDDDGYDRDGYNKEGYNKAGYDRDGFNKEGYNKKGYDRDGYNKKGFDKRQCNREGYCKDRRRRSRI